MNQTANDVDRRSAGLPSLAIIASTQGDDWFVPSGHTSRTRWPSTQEVLSEGRLRSHAERLKHALRMFSARHHRPLLLRALDRLPLWQEMFRRNPRCFFPPLSHFLDRRWNVHQRFEACLTDLEVARTTFDWPCARMIALGHRQALLKNPVCELWIGPNGINLQEGYWALTLQSPDGTELFNLSFAFTSRRSVLVASIQGAEGARREGGEKCAIQKMTKAAHGLRPAHLLLAMFQQVCVSWGVHDIVGIDPVYHIKGRWNHRRSRLKFDYRAIWQEAGGVRRPDGNWDLPPQPRRRSNDDMPARKRAQYRRRYQLLDELAAQLGRRESLS